MKLKIRTLIYFLFLFISCAINAQVPHNEKESARVEIAIGDTLADGQEKLLAKQKQRLADLKAKFGDLDFKDFTTVGGKTKNDISDTMYKEMYAEMANRITWTDSSKTAKLNELLGSGSTAPQNIVCQQGMELFKVVRKGAIPSQTSEYWLARSDLEEAISTGTNFESKVGLPLGSMSEEYDIYIITADTLSRVYESTVASTTQRGYTTTGGATQTLVL